MIQPSYFWVYIPKNWKQALKRNIHVHNSIIPNGQELEANQDNTLKSVIIYAMEYYAALKREKILSHATIQIEPQGPTQSQKVKYCLVPFMWNI